MTTAAGARNAAARTQEAVGAAAVWMDRVSKWYGSVIGVNEVSLEIGAGVVGLLGPNGAGKSTLMKLMTGQLSPNLGAVRLFGRRVRSAASLRRLGYCPDADAFYEEMTGREFVASMLRLAGFRKSEASRLADRALATVGMSDRRDKPLRGCSKGMRQRVKLAQALAHDPDLLILDEPLSGLDPVGRREFCSLFRRLADEGRTVVISSHVMEEVEAIAERVILVGGGRVLAQGEWREIAKFLSTVPQRIRVASPTARALAARLVDCAGVVRLDFRGVGECIVTTTDPAEAYDRIGELARLEGFRVERLWSDSNWAETLFGIAEEA